MGITTWKMLKARGHGFIIDVRYGKRRYLTYALIMQMVGVSRKMRL